MAKARWAVGVVVAAVVLVAGGTWVYLNVVRDDPPPRLALDTGSDPVEGAAADTTSSSQAHADPSDEPVDLSGTWVPTPESVVGYRVGEVLFGQRTEAVGRTSEIHGEMVIDGTTVTEARFEVDMATLESDDGRRDGQFRGRIMDVATYPTGSLVLVEPIELGEVPPEGQIVDVTASVEITLRGTSRTVPVDLEARRRDGTIEVNGGVLIVFEEWGIPDPSNVAASTDDEGDLEFLLVLEPAS